MNPFDGGENQQDESEILGNQDETDPGRPDRDDVMMGAGPTDLDTPKGADDREIDLVDQMDRTIRAREHTDGTLRNADGSNDEWIGDPTDEAAEIDTEDLLADGMRETPAEDVPALPARGSATGAYTDIGAGRSGVTRHP